MTKRLTVALSLVALTLSACDRIEERQNRFTTLSKSVAGQLTGLWSEDRADSGFSRPMAERGISSKFIASDERGMVEPSYRILLNSLILKPAEGLPRPVTSQSEEATEIPAPQSVSTIMSGLASFGFDYTTDPLPGGLIRLTYKLPASPITEGQETDPWLDRFITLDDQVPACTISGASGLSQSDTPLMRLSCLKDWLMATGGFEAVNFDSLLELQRADDGFAGVDPLSDFRWSYTPALPADSTKGPGPIAILDTGVIAEHPDLRPMDPRYAFDVISDPDAAGDGTGMDRIPLDAGDLCDPANVFHTPSWHGTAMAGLIGLSRPDNNIGISPMQSDAPLAVVRVAGRCGARLSDVINGLGWAGGISSLTTGDGEEVWIDRPASVIVLPLASSGDCPAALQSTLNALDERGIYIVAAGGNSGRLASTVYPANCRHVLAVAASGPDGVLTGYSNYGLDIDIMAPGGNLSQDLNSDSWPDGILVPTPSKTCRDPLTGSDVETCSYAIVEGTSFAAAHVASALYEARKTAPDDRPGIVLQNFLASRGEISPLACKGPCPQTSDGVPIDTLPGQCYRRCGIGHL